MAEVIAFDFEGTKYRLEYTRRTAREMGKNGFDPREIESNPLLIVDLFAGAFLAHHPKTSRQTIDRIYDSLGNKQALIEKLMQMYAEPLNALLAEPVEGNAVSWVVS